MPHNTEETIQLLLKTNKEQEETIADLRATIKALRATVANLNETLDELKRKLFGTSSEKTFRASSGDAQETDPEEEQAPETTTVKEHTRTRKKKCKRQILRSLIRLAPPIGDACCNTQPEGLLTMA